MTAIDMNPQDTALFAQLPEPPPGWVWERWGAFGGFESSTGPGGSLVRVWETQAGIEVHAAVPSRGSITLAVGGALTVEGAIRRAAEVLGAALDAWAPADGAPSADEANAAAKVLIRYQCSRGEGGRWWEMAGKHENGDPAPIFVSVTVGQLSDKVASLVKPEEPEPEGDIP